MGNETVKITINDIQIKGVVLDLHPHHFTVEIVSPYQDIRLSSPRIPKYSDDTCLLYTDVLGNLSKRGKETATETLRYIYEGYQLFLNNLSNLTKIYESLFFHQINGTVESTSEKELTKIDYEFFQLITRKYHLKSSFELVQTLIQKFIIGKMPEEG